MLSWLMANIGTVLITLALLGGMIYMLFFKKYHESTKLTEKLK